jgi:hypothetical protein
MLLDSLDPDQGHQITNLRFLFGKLEADVVVGLYVVVAVRLS